MSNRNSFAIWLLLALLLPSCGGGIEEEMLTGTWQGAQLREGSEISDLDVSAVRFEFRPNGTYEYKGTLKYREAGNYYTLGKLLYCTDTLAPERREKAVKVLRLSQDSLFFQMNDNGNPQLLKLSRMDSL